ncbi:hypothetical protein ACJ41O_015031 [Fusarium nematophilum]
MSDTTTPVNLQAYKIDELWAPDHCETCNLSVPDESSRREHMNDKGHRRCLYCGDYFYLAGWVDHCELRHQNMPWNDHMVYSQDAYDMKEGKAQAWAQEAFRKKEEETS